MTLKVETSRYEFAHGRKPKGRGLWMFEVRIPGRDWLVLPVTAMAYSKAASFAVSKARSIGAAQVRVCS